MFQVLLHIFMDIINECIIQRKVTEKIITFGHNAILGTENQFLKSFEE